MKIPAGLFAGLLPRSRPAALRDLLAGVNLAAVDIPQVLGYARIAGMPVITGLYTVLLPLIAFAIFGSSRHLVVAADSATAAIFSSSLSRMAPVASEKYMALVGMLTLLIAGLLLLARIFKLGFLADFLSRTALVGFLPGVGLQVGVAMLGGMLGVDVVSHRTLDQFWELLRGAPSVSVQSTGLSIFVVASILLGRRFAPRFPVPLVLVVGTIGANTEGGLVTSAGARRIDRGRVWRSLCALADPAGPGLSAKPVACYRIVAKANGVIWNGTRTLSLRGDVHDFARDHQSA